MNGVVRQLGDAPPDPRIGAASPSARETTSVLLGDAREEPDKLLYPADAKREPRSFTITLARPMGSKARVAMTCRRQ